MPRLRLLAALAVLAAAAACRDGTAPETVREPSFAQLYLFDHEVISWSWGYQRYGTCIDSLGHVLRFDHSFAVWTPAAGDTLTRAELDEKYLADVDTVASVPRAELLERFGLVAGAAQGPVTDPVLVHVDGAAIVRSCYRYDPALDRYVRTKLLVSGNTSQVNQAPEAVALAAWLDSLVLAAPSGRK